jgi:sugar lactone lactonase YvrE
MQTKESSRSLRVSTMTALSVALALTVSTGAFASTPPHAVTHSAQGVAPSASLTPVGKLTVFAGNGSFGLPRPGPATKSALAGPTGVALDAHGDLFIADHANNMVEEVTPGGKLSVVAGTGKPGVPTPGPATKSPLNAPSGVALDAHGDLFIADSNNNVVEEVTPAGKLSVVVGNGHAAPPTPGPATKSALDDPSGLAVDAHGNLFVADYNNNTVAKVTPAGKLSVVVGNGHGGPPTPGPATKSALNNPSGVALDAHGDLFIADSNNNVVEEVTPAGKLSVVAGNGTLGPPTPGPATKSGLQGPSGVALDGHGDLFVADWANNVVEEVSPAGKLSVAVGNGDEGPPTPGPATASPLGGANGGPTGVVVGAHGSLFVSDQGNNVIEEVTY